MKRQLLPMLIAALAGAAAASAAVLLAGVSTRRSSPAARTTTVVSAPSGTSGARQVVASTGLTATQIYQRDSPGVVSIKAVTQDGESVVNVVTDAGRQAACRCGDPGVEGRKAVVV